MGCSGGAPVRRLDETGFEECGADEVGHGGLLGIALTRRLALQAVEASAAEAEEEQRVPFLLPFNARRRRWRCDPGLNGANGATAACRATAGHSDVSYWQTQRARRCDPHEQHAHRHVRAEHAHLRKTAPR